MGVLICRDLLERVLNGTVAADGECYALAESLDSDLESLKRLDGDHYEGALDWARRMRHPRPE